MMLILCVAMSSMMHFFFLRMSQLRSLVQASQPAHCVRVGVGQVNGSGIWWAEGGAVVDYMVCGLVGVSTYTGC